MNSCSICLGSLPAGEDYHPECLESLFGVPTLPVLDVELSKLYSLAASKMAGKMSISGAQEKVSLTLSEDRTALEVTDTGGRYILKPETTRFSSVPQNELLTMRLAQLVSIEVPPCGLIRLKDGTTSYIIKRFDRLDDGGKLQVEDFCQLALKPLRHKYDGSAEECVRILRKYASEPLIEIQKLYRLLLFVWWTDNGDMHLKNFSLLTLRDGMRRLSPAYDLVCTKLVIPDDKLALPIGGKTRNLKQRNWLDFAKYCEIPERAARRLISEQTEVLKPALELIAASFLPENMKSQYEEFLKRNTTALMN
ncbi:MAG TPA: HipA domain-containing protein [Planctomycetaceae bacterium]|nr:HipA domain-containing protein [Planctomycetaceae bacterium]